MDKSVIRKALVMRLMDVLAGAEENYRKNKEVAREAPSPMESHSDTSKFQSNVLADTAREQMESLRTAIRKLEALRDDVFPQIVSGSLVTVAEKTSQQMLYIVPRGAGGYPVRVEGENIFSLAEDAPLAKALMGSRTGEEIKLSTPSGTRVVRIIGVV